MRCKLIKDEDFNHYKKPSMVIAAVQCNGKCCKEANIDESICINTHLKEEETKNVSDTFIVDKYLSNSISSALVIAGLEPFEQFREVYDLVSTFRTRCNDDIVIYTGYYEDEIDYEIKQLEKFKNIYIKFGRYIPNRDKKYDEVLGIKLVSDNQYGKKIS